MIQHLDKDIGLVHIARQEEAQNGAAAFKTLEPDGDAAQQDSDISPRLGFAQQILARAGTHKPGGQLAQARFRLAGQRLQQFQLADQGG